MANDIELSERECEILRLVATGASNKEIAQELYISTNTVKVHLRNIFAKIEVTSRTEATLYAIREGLVPTPVGADLASSLAAGLPDEEIFPSNGNNQQDAELPLSEGIYRQQSRPRWIPLSIVTIFVLILGAFGLIWLQPGEQPAQTPPSPSPEPTLARWEARAPLPSPRSGMAAVGYGNRIYVIAGETGQGTTGETNQYDPETGAWSALKPKPLPVSDVQAVLLGEKIYVPGGRQASGAPSDRLDVYDPRRDVWEEKASMPAPRSAYALAAFEGRLYLFGGWDGARAVNTVFEYDPGSDAWIERSPMPTGRAFAGAAVAGGKIYVVGGINGDRALAVNETYYPQRDQTGEPAWDTFQPLPEGRGEMAIASLADVIYVLGGVTSGRAELIPEDAALQYLAETDTWQAFEVPAAPIGQQSALVPLGNYLYLLGGKASSELLSTHESYRAIFTVVLPFIKQ